MRGFGAFREWLGGAERSGRDEGPPAPVRALVPEGEKVLAAAPAADGTWLIGTRLSLVIAHEDRARVIPWERVEDARWEREGEVLVITEVGDFGRPRPSYELVVTEPGRLLELLRERVTASVVLQKWEPVEGSRGIRVIGRRSPAGSEITWMHAYDEGLDPDDPQVRAAAEAMLATAQREVGDLG